MDGRLLWVLLSVSTIASLAGAGFAAWAVLAWRRTPAGKATEAIEAGIRVVTFRLAQMDGHLGAMDATLQAEAAKTIAVPELEQLLGRNVVRGVPPPSGPREVAHAAEPSQRPETLPPPSPRASAPGEGWAQAGPPSPRGDTLRLSPGDVAPPRVTPPAWVAGPPREQQG